MGDTSEIQLGCAQTWEMDNLENLRYQRWLREGTKIHYFFRRIQHRFLGGLDGRLMYTRMQSRCIKHAVVHAMHFAELSRLRA